MSQYYSFVKRFLDIAWPDKMLSDNNIVMGFSIGGFLPCLHIQEKGLKQSCSQFINALGWLPFREWLSSTECGINCQCWWKSTGCTVDITLANGLGEVGTKLISAGFILWPGCPRLSSISKKTMLFGRNKLFVPQNAERSVNLKWNGRPCKFFPFSRHFGWDQEYFSGSACR